GRAAASGEARPGPRLYQRVDPVPGELHDQGASDEHGEDLPVDPESRCGAEPGPGTHRRIREDPVGDPPEPLFHGMGLDRFRHTRLPDAPAGRSPPLPTPPSPPQPPPPPRPPLPPP